MLPPNALAGHLAGQLVEPERDGQPLFAGHPPVALDLLRYGLFGRHVSWRSSSVVIRMIRSAAVNSVGRDTRGAMRRLAVFNQVTLDGYFAGPGGDISWAKGRQDPKFHQFVEENARGGGVLVFGRITYELMASYWPTPLAAQIDPVVAERMNNLPKVVFSRTLAAAAWSNTTLLKGDLAAEIRKLKRESGDDMTILGSGSLVAQLADAGLIDEYQLVVYPVVLGQGRTMFDGVKKPLFLTLTRSRTFANGNVFLSYVPAE